MKLRWSGEWIFLFLFFFDFQNFEVQNLKKGKKESRLRWRATFTSTFLYLLQIIHITTITLVIEKNKVGINFMILNEIT